MKRITRLAVPAGLLLACQLTASAAEPVKPASDGFSTLIEAREKRDGVEPQPEPQSTPLADPRRWVSMPAPFHSVIRAYYGPAGELRWGCAIEPRPLVEDRFNNRIPD